MTVLRDVLTFLFVTLPSAWHRWQWDRQGDQKLAERLRRDA